MKILQKLLLAIFSFVAFPVLVFAQATDVSCNGANDAAVSVTITSLPGETWTCDWSGPGLMQSITASENPAGEYTCAITDLFAGTYIFTANRNPDPLIEPLTAEFIVNEPPALIVDISPTDASQCSASDGSITASPSGGTPDYLYLWDDPGAQTTATATGLAIDTYNVTVTDANGCTAMNTATVSCIPEADLSITKTGNTNLITVGNPLIYTLEVNNAGPDTATDVVVTDVLPAGVNLVSTSGCAEDPAGVPTCTLGDIAANNSAMFTIEVMVNAGTIGTITNSASVTSAVFDPVDANSANEDTMVMSLPPAPVTIPTISAWGLGLLIALLGLILFFTNRIHRRK